MTRRRAPYSRSVSTAIGSSDSRIKLRLIGLLILAIVLCSLVGLWLWIRSWPSATVVLGPSLLEQPLDEPALSASASEAELAALATAEVERLLAKYPDHPPALSVAARKAYLFSDNAAARKAWTKALDIDPQFVEATYGLGLVAFGVDDYESAALFFQDVAYRSPGDLRVPVMLADALLHIGKTNDAILVLEQHLSSEQSSVQAWIQLGQAHLQGQNYQRAIVCFQKVLSFNPESADALYGLSRAFAAIGDKEQAKENSDKFRQLADQDIVEDARAAHELQDNKLTADIVAQVYADVARVEQEQGDLEAAEKAMLRSYKLAPDNTEYLTQFQQLMLVRNQPREVVALSEKLLEESPKDVDLWLTLGNAYAELGDAESAVKAFETAIELNPQDERTQQAQRVIRRLRLQ